MIREDVCERKKKREEGNFFDQDRFNWENLYKFGIILWLLKWGKDKTEERNYLLLAARINNYSKKKEKLKTQINQIIMREFIPYDL